MPASLLLRTLAFLGALTGAPPHLHGVITLTLGGSDETRDPFIFQQVGGLVLAADGRIVVADGKTEQLRLFSPAGKFLYAFGQPGQGPGDFGQICCPTFDPAGRLWVGEFGNRRYSVIALDATRAHFVRSVPMPGQPGYVTTRVMWDGMHHLVDVGQTRTATQFYYVRNVLDSAGRVLHADSIGSPPADSLAPSWVHITATAHARSTSTFPQPLGATAFHAFGPGGQLATAAGGHYAVRWSALDGHLVAQISGNDAAPLTSPRERIHVESVLVEIAGETHSSRSDVKLTVPERKPVLADLFFDLDGRLWVQRTVADGAPNEADVYGPRGVLLETVTWPAGVSLTDGTIHGNTALGLMKDAEGSEQIVRLEFKPGL